MHGDSRGHHKRCVSAGCGVAASPESLCAGKAECSVGQKLQRNSTGRAFLSAPSCFRDYVSGWIFKMDTNFLLGILPPLVRLTAEMQEQC
ncbi:hypothetical protein MC885_012938 [Smutsia gigantea]|nr:hypothetical protein MC885_012938 [Smutsia gigantea]